MNPETCTTTPWPGGPRAAQGTDPAGNAAQSCQGITIRHLDQWDADPQGGSPAAGRILWVSLTHPRSLLGALLDEMSFEGAWLESAGQARIRLLGHGEHRIPAPLFHSPRSARAWLASELLARIPDPRDTPTRPGTPDAEDRLAA